MPVVLALLAGIGVGGCQSSGAWSDTATIGEAVPPPADVSPPRRWPPPTGSEVVHPGGLSRRPGPQWQAQTLGYVNTAVQREPDYTNSPYKDVYIRGEGEPIFHDWRREVIAGGYEPLRWVVNLVAMPVSAVVQPYWDWPLDYGPAAPGEPVGPTQARRVAREPRVNQ